jgi:hypothetical protein
MAAYLDANLLNLMIQGYLDQTPGALEWKLSASIFDLDIQAPPPIFSFGPQGANAPPHANIGVSLAGMTVRVGLGGTAAEDALVIVFDCDIHTGIVKGGGRIEFGDFTIHLTPHKTPALTPTHLLAGVMEADVLVNEAVKLLIPHLQAWVAKLPFPQFHNLFGTTLNAVLVDVDVCEVQGQYMLCAAVEFEGHEAVSTAVAALSTPPFARTSSGTLMLLVSEKAMSLVIHSLLVGHEVELRRKQREAKMRLGIQSRVRAEAARFEIRGSFARVSVRLRFKKTRGGVKLGGSWKWIRVKLKSARAGVDIALVTEERGVHLVFKGIRKLDVKVKGRTLGISADMLEKVIAGGIDEFLPVLNRWFRGKRFELFQLPDTIPGTQIPMPFIFAPDGLRLGSGVILAEFTLAPGGRQVQA